MTVSSQPGLTISKLVVGANMAVWYDFTQSGVASTLALAGFHATRFPGGSFADKFHWQTQTLCGGATTLPQTTFDNFMRDLALPASLDVAVTVNYGSNSSCNGPGDPAEAAAWVAESKANGYGVKYWTVGNEEYGSWEYDLHTPSHDPATYASAFATGYYPAMKAQDATARVGVLTDPGSNWDATVLKAAAPYDFVEFHHYAQRAGNENDAYLLTQAPQVLTTRVRELQADLAAAGHPNTPIYAGELGSVDGARGKQTMSIVQALYAGMAIDELIDDGVFRATWWLGYGGCSGPQLGGNFSPSLYGWQTFGGFMLFSDGIPEPSCPAAPAIARGVPLPTVRTLSMMSQVARQGERVLGTTVTSAYPNVRAYAMTHGSAYAVVLYNLDENNAVSVPVAVASLAHGSSVNVTTYGKAQYDLSQNNIWSGPVTSHSGAFTSPVVIALPPWSMTVAILAP